MPAEPAAEGKPADGGGKEDEGTEGTEGAAEGASDGGTGEGDADEGTEGKPEGDDKDALIAQLQAQINELSKGATQPAAEPTPAPVAAEPVTIGDYFPDEETYNKALDDPKEMNKVLSRVAQDAAAKAREDTLRTIPAIITPLVQTTIAVNMGAAKFYQDNPDLGDKKEFVGYVTNDLIGKNPDWKMDKLFSELGKEVRTRLGLKEKATTVDRKATVARPAFVPKGGGGRGATAPGSGPAPDPNSIESQIEDMLSL
jgi:hypothetical protein